MVYEKFDKIICINLKERNDKYNNVKQVFEKLNIPVEFYFAEKHSISGRIGCFESHINVITDAYNNNMKNILIFEDDIFNTTSYNENIMNDIYNYLIQNPGCEYFQLGYTILPHEIISYFTSSMITNNILKYNGNTTHAYILNRNGMNRILHTWKQSVYEKELDLDIYYKELFKDNGACICPILFDQNFCIDNDNEIATTTYYKIMRNVSCTQYKYSLLYYISLFRKYIFQLLLLFTLIYIFIKLNK
jgi:GR25 family glycosyltransferase involved in LPS biosynthesis